MRGRVRRLRGLISRYRTDRRLPPVVWSLYRDLFRARLVDFRGRCSAPLLPTASSRGTGGDARRRFDGRRVITAAPLSMPLAHLGLDHADELVRRLEGAGLEPFVVDTDGLVIHFGLPLDQRSRAIDTLRSLGDAEAGWTIEWFDRARSGRVAADRAHRSRRIRVARRLRVSRLFTEGERAAGAEAAIDLTFWAPGSSGLIEQIGTRGEERFDPRAAATVEMIGGRAYPGRSAFPVGNDAERFTEPIDIVITWVDGADPAWLEAKAAWDTDHAHDPAALDPARFRTRDEVRFLLRSLWRNCGWANHVYLVTAGQRPEWLDDHPWVSVVDHSEILPESALPTFNSHAIEANLHHIEGLSEHFIYFNDDICVGRAVSPDLFFTSNGLARTFPSQARVPAVEDDATQHVDTAARRGRELLQEAFGRVVAHKPLHSAYPLRRSVLEEIDARFPDIIDATTHSRFRSPSDLSVAASFAQHYGLLSGHGVVGSLVGGYVHVESGRLPHALDRLRLARDRDTICINETADATAGRDDAEARIAAFYREYFPVSAPWESEPGS